MENLTINVSKQLDGFTFSLTPLTRQTIKKEFPLANPVQSIFVAFDVRANFDLLHGKIEKYIYPALTGISEVQEDVNVKFVDSSTDKELYSFSSSHVSN